MEDQFNINEVERAMYLAIHNLISACETVNEQEGVAYFRTSDFAEAKFALEQYEWSLGPLPSWAESRNLKGELVQKAQLFTKNGRRTGNGVIAYIVKPEHIQLGPDQTIYHVITDSGNCMDMLRTELDNQFEVGDFIMKENHIMAMQLRQKD